MKKVFVRETIKQRSRFISHAFYAEFMMNQLFYGNATINLKRTIKEVMAK